MPAALAPCVFGIVAGAMLCVASLTDQRALRWAYVFVSASFSLAAYTGLVSHLSSAGWR
jgi:cytochrome c biogenesis protein CcdA